MRKRARPSDLHDPSVVPDDPFQQEDGEDDEDDDDDEKGGKSDKKAGRRKIKIEFIQDKSRRHITFSKRKAGIMKKAYELSTLTGTQVLLLVVSETGLVYTFTTAKLQPLVTQPEGKNLIQACLNAPHSQAPTSGHPPPSMTRGSANPMGASVHGGRQSQAAAAAPANVVGGLSIGGPGKDAEDNVEDDDNAGSPSVSPVMAPNRGPAGASQGQGPSNRRRTTSNVQQSPVISGGISKNTRGAKQQQQQQSQQSNSSPTPISPHLTHPRPDVSLNTSPTITHPQPQQQQSSQPHQSPTQTSTSVPYSTSPTSYHPHSHHSSSLDPASSGLYHHNGQAHVTSPTMSHHPHPHQPMMPGYMTQPPPQQPGMHPPGAGMHPQWGAVPGGYRR